MTVDGAKYVEGARCSAPSSLFRGPCVIDMNCQTMCEKEGFEDGHCKGLRRRCICYKDCGDDQSPPTYT